MENIKVIIKQGNSPGKNIVILAGVHGNEICGIKAFDKLIPNIQIKKGNVIFIYANLEAQKRNKRFIEFNLNRCFLDEQPEKMKNTLEGKTAKAIIPYLQKADILLDIHSSKSSGNQKFLICEKNCLELTSCFQPKKIIMNIDKVQKGGTDGYMPNNNKQGICIECGLHEAKDSIEVAKEAILNLLKKYKSIDGQYKSFEEKEIYQVQYMYKNRNGPFRLAGNFKDFRKVDKKTLIGYDGNKEIFIEKEDIVVFPHEAEEIGKECFVILRSYPWQIKNN